MESPVPEHTPAPILLRLHNPHAHDALFRVVVHWGSLPEGTELHVAVGHTRDEGKIEPPFPDEVEDGCDGTIRLKTFRTYHLTRTPERRNVRDIVLLLPSFRGWMKPETKTRRTRGTRRALDVLRVLRVLRATSNF